MVKYFRGTNQEKSTYEEGRIDDIMIDTDGSIYHYTDINGITGILENGCLWATHYDYTNDSSELRIFPTLLNSWIAENHPPGWNAIKDRMIESFYRMVEGESSKSIPFISSFCNDDGNTLSQWRGYGKNNGYSIGFHYETLEKYKQIIMDRSAIDFIDIRKVAYGYTHYSKDFDKDMTDFIKIFNTYYDDRFNNFIPHLPLSSSQIEALNEAHIIYYKWLVSSKHSYFSEEKEFRIVLFVPKREKYIDNTKQRISIKDRHSADTIIPYVEIFKEIKHLPINRIVIGPSNDREDKKRLVESLLNKYGLRGIIVDIPEIPFRG